MYPIAMHEEISERFWKKTAYEATPHPILGTYCLLWTGDKTRGYGRVRIGSRTDGTRRRARAHRVCYEMMVGPIPHGANVTQKCGNKACVNHEHLELVLEDPPSDAPEIVEEDVQYMRAVCKVSTPETLQDKKEFLMDEYSIDRPYLDDILARRTWQHC